MEKVIAFLTAGIGILLIAVALGLLLAYPVMLLWNGCLIPAVTGLHEISWMQAWGINILCGILFRSKSSK